MGERSGQAESLSCNGRNAEPHSAHLSAVYNQRLMSMRRFKLSGVRIDVSLAVRLLGAGVSPLRASVRSASLRYLCAVVALTWLAALAAAPVAAQRDLEVDARAQLFPEVTVGVAGLKSRVVGAQPGMAAATGAAAGASSAAAASTPGAAGAPGTSATGTPGSAPTAQDPAEERLYYLLFPALRTPGAEAAGATILVFKADGTRVAQIPAPVAKRGQAAAGATAADLSTVQAPDALVVYGHDFDVDAQGRVFIADRAAGAVRIFNAEGALAGTIRIAAPTSVAVLGAGEVAVTTLRANKLVTVYAERSDPGGQMVWRPVREFGEPAQIAEPDASAELNRFLNIGRLASDAEHNIYYAFAYAPEPTVRKYDAFGYKAYESELATPDFLAAAQTARRNIGRLGDERFTLGPVINPGFTPTVTAVAADPVTQEIWVALGAVLLHFDRDGVRRQTYRLFTADGNRVEASAILVEPDRLVVASATRGVFDFPRPDKPRRPAAKAPAKTP